eukprot:TRINITY_DN12665_c0_g1_i1.p1 TRINITY_DN12665_c0_g1~~TRINITY_DN12665_c0_g1_i1.p1  ORF type:complete len:141 (+),score=18.08 TRINITY_DN12665_c0_g1_i1:207-629(+)
MAYRYDRIESSSEDELTQQRNMRSFLLSLQSQSLPRHPDRPNPSAAPLAIEELTLLVFDENLLVKYAGEKCVICMGGYEMGDEVNKLECSHMFHNVCLIDWLKQTNTCPFCRFELPTLDEDYEAAKYEKKETSVYSSMYM